MKFLRGLSHQLLDFQFVRFLLVGFLNTAVNFGVLNLLMVGFKVYSGWLFSLFEVIAITCSVINSYYLNKNWTFQNKDKTKILEFSKFGMISLATIFINVSLASFLVNSIGPQFNISPLWWANLSAFASVGITILINFFGYKYLVFAKQNKA